jgi:cyclopropane fatty-acyl-phospholipid synthase-like methyltransferase
MPNATAKQFSEACEENKEPILAVLREALADRRTVLEIGSGTGQHAVWFGHHLPHLSWQTSDVAANHPSIRAWLNEAGLPNVAQPLLLDVSAAHWPQQAFDAVFSANTAHIMSWPSVQDMFRGIGRVLQAEGVFCLYGPFNYNGRYTSESNARFDAWLRRRDSLSGVRDFVDLDRLAGSCSMALQNDYAMPVNNRLLVWRKRIASPPHGGQEVRVP